MHIEIIDTGDLAIEDNANWAVLLGEFIGMKDGTAIRIDKIEYENGKLPFLFTTAIGGEQHLKRIRFSTDEKDRNIVICNPKGYKKGYLIIGELKRIRRWWPKW